MAGICLNQRIRRYWAAARFTGTMSKNVNLTSQQIRLNVCPKKMLATYNTNVIPKSLGELRSMQPLTEIVAFWLIVQLKGKKLTGVLTLDSQEYSVVFLDTEHFGIKWLRNIYKCLFILRSNGSVNPDSLVEFTDG